MANGSNGGRRWSVAEAILAGVGILTILGTVIMAYGRVTDRIVVMETDIQTLKANTLVNARLDLQRKDLDELMKRVDQINERELEER